MVRSSMTGTPQTGRPGPTARMRPSRTWTSPWGNSPTAESMESTWASRMTKCSRGGSEGDAGTSAVCAKTLEGADPKAASEAAPARKRRRPRIGRYVMGALPAVLTEKLVITTFQRLSSTVSIGACSRLVPTTNKTSPARPQRAVVGGDDERFNSAKPLPRLFGFGPFPRWSEGRWRRWTPAAKNTGNARQFAVPPSGKLLIFQGP